jgi:hypothetical protein
MQTHFRELLVALRIGIAVLAFAVPTAARSAPAGPPTAKPAVEPSAAGTPLPTDEPVGNEPEPPSDPATPPPEPPEPTPSVDASAAAALQQDARGLRDELFKARARVSIVASRLFTTRIALQLRSNLERFYTVTALTLRIDGAPVYVQENGLPQAAGDLFDVFAAPGSHELSISAELVSRRDATYKLRLDHAITFAVDADTRVSTRLQLREHGNMWRFAARRRGHSDVRIQLRAQAKRTEQGKRAAKAAAGGKASVGTGGSK